MADRDALALRNQALAAIRNTRTRRQQVRGLLLRITAALPVPRGYSDGRTILLIRPDHLGDVLLTMPAVQALARAIPEARLVALVGPWSAGVISAYPEIDLTLTLPFPGFSRQPARTSAQPYLLALQWARKLRRLNAAEAIVFRPDHWWGALLAHLAGIPSRIGFDLSDVRPFLTEAIPLLAGHAVEHNLALVARWLEPGTPPPPLTFPVAEADRVVVRDLLGAAGIPPEAPRVIIHPGSGTLLKQWPPERWAYVADRLAARWGAPILLTGGEHELGLARSIADRMASPTVVLTGKTSLAQLAALYDSARVVLGPDSGPLHLAVAVGTPTVHLFGPADPVEFGPWGSPARHRVLTTPIACRPCRIIDWPGATADEHPCVRDIDPDTVLAAALAVASET